MSAAVACGGSPAPAEAPAAAELHVSVVNGAGRAAVCREVAAKLGLDPGAVEDVRDENGRLNYAFEKTVIRYGDARGPAAERIQADLGLGVLAPAPGITGVEVIVGWDAAAEGFPGAPADGVYISKAEKAIFFFEGVVLTHVWPCAIGKPDTPTPTGDFKTTVTLEKPTWYWRGKAIPPGPDNGLGDWFIGINKKGYGIHGTNEPASIGTAASHGCVRMYNEDAGRLVELVSPGTPVVIGD